jgi:hypothetical protein
MKDGVRCDRYWKDSSHIHDAFCSAHNSEHSLKKIRPLLSGVVLGSSFLCVVSVLSVPLLVNKARIRATTETRKLGHHSLLWLFGLPETLTFLPRYNSRKFAPRIHLFNLPDSTSPADQDSIFHVEHNSKVKSTMLSNCYF